MLYKKDVLSKMGQILGHSSLELACLSPNIKHGFN
jgi:hypothetical protein